MLKNLPRRGIAHCLSLVLLTSKRINGKSLRIKSLLASCRLESTRNTTTPILQPRLPFKVLCGKRFLLETTNERSSNKSKARRLLANCAPDAAKKAATRPSQSLLVSIVCTQNLFSHLLLRKIQQSGQFWIRQPLRPTSH